MSTHHGSSVAIVGAGPSGLVAARYLKAHGFEPVIIEAGSAIGGQWNEGSPASRVWRGMRTNTSRVLTAFSDLDHPEGTPIYPTVKQMQAYLEAYVANAGIADAIRLDTRVERLERAEDGGWQLTTRHDDRLAKERFARVVVATGRYHDADVPDIEGLPTFSGKGGVCHSGEFGTPERFRGLRVLVAGQSISALEIASELAQHGVEVSVAARRQRYVLTKLLAGVPTDHRAFTRFAALAGAVLPPEVLDASLRDFVVSQCGSPEQFGAPKPSASLFAAGLTQSQAYLALVAERRIQPRPWIDRVQGSRVRFTNGVEDDVDAIVLATGYRVSLPFVSDEIAGALGLDGHHIDLFDCTFHPELDGLGFLGLFAQAGPYMPVLELQARWLAYAWAGLCPMPTRREMADGVARSRAARGGPQELPMHVMAALFATRAGVEPDPQAWGDLERALLFGPLSPASYRLSGPDAMPDAPERVRRAAAEFGAIVNPEFTPAERAQLAAVRPQATLKAS